MKRALLISFSAHLLLLVIPLKYNKSFSENIDKEIMVEIEVEKNRQMVQLPPKRLAKNKNCVRRKIPTLEPKLKEIKEELEEMSIPQVPEEEPNLYSSEPISSEFDKSTHLPRRPVGVGENSYSIEFPTDKINLESERLAKEELLSYQEIIKKKIESAKRYPRKARRKRIEGIVYLKFVILSNGSLKEVKIKRSSGSSILDEEAVSTINRASPFSPLPGGLKKESLTLELSLLFRLKK